MRIDPRKKRLAGLIAKYVAKILGIILLIILLISAIAAIFGSATPGVLVLLLSITFVGYVAYELASEKLRDMERDEERVMDRMRKDD